eukprot:TRINITY_DN232_c0_g1_i1.p2 TRINITY_DN232_c0_g1~~TRINITY_DN232_c0_g1_i1.p2  ORF type:complete len:119 (-),score=43.28 TRINITY_DN232_c0_g1_i1:554-910(-)
MINVTVLNSVNGTMLSILPDTDQGQPSSSITIIHTKDLKHILEVSTTHNDDSIQHFTFHPDSNQLTILGQFSTDKVKLTFQEQLNQQQNQKQQQQQQNQTDNSHSSDTTTDQEAQPPQ